MNTSANNTSNNGFDLNRPTIICLLYLGSFLIGITSVIGIIVAHMWRNEEHAPWEDSHYTYLIRTFWAGLLYILAATIISVITFFLLSWLVYPLVAVWFAVRTIKALLAAQKQEPIADPHSWIF